MEICVRNTWDRYFHAWPASASNAARREDTKKPLLGDRAGIPGKLLPQLLLAQGTSPLGRAREHITCKVITFAGAFSWESQ